MAGEERGERTAGEAQNRAALPRQGGSSCN
jgi:hypothetical protein